MSTKYVYFFGDGQADGDATMKSLLGGKGANLAEMVRFYSQLMRNASAVPPTP